jgi:hypothetical protein
MSIKKLCSLLTLLAALTLLSACGESANSQPSKPAGKPDSVRITLNPASPTPQNQSVTLTNLEMTQKLFDMIFALPAMPQQKACTMELGPAYTLTFLQNSKTLATINAERYGCRPITIQGEQGERQTSQEFWPLLDKAINEATPPAKPDKLAILRADQGNQTALISSAEKAQRFYTAILELQFTPQAYDCPTDTTFDYRMVFRQAEQLIPAYVSLSCNRIKLDGGDQSRTGVYMMDEPFKKLMNELFTSVTFAPAQPDQLTLTYDNRADATPNNADPTKTITVKDTGLMQQLYAKIPTMKMTARDQNCPSGEDKLANQGRFSTFHFTQWGLPIQEVGVYEGSCTQISIPVKPLTTLTGETTTLQGDEQFWDMVHRAQQSTG